MWLRNNKKLGRRGTADGRTVGIGRRHVTAALLVLILGLASLCMSGCGVDDIDISGYADETIALSGITDDDITLTG